MRLPRIHQEYKQILYESDSGHLGDDFRAVWDELRMLKQHYWCAFSIRYPRSFSDNSWIIPASKIRSHAEEMKFYIKIF